MPWTGSVSRAVSRPGSRRRSEALRRALSSSLPRLRREGGLGSGWCPAMRQVPQTGSDARGLQRRGCPQTCARGHWPLQAPLAQVRLGGGGAAADGPLLAASPQALAGGV